jgi:hypothetical protein
VHGVARPSCGQAAIAVALAAALAGCSSTPHRDAVTDAAVAFVGDLEKGDGAAACGLLTSDARTAVSGATDTSCADAIASVKERGGPVSSVQVWGDAAQVHVGGDVVFLRRISGKWAVSGAGCKPQPAGPYDCQVGG